MNEKEIKLFDIILYICDQLPRFENGALKINKLIWFIESEFYRQHEKTITGVTFAAIDHGPIMNDYKVIFEKMKKNGLIDYTIHPITGRYLFTPQKKSDLDSLNPSEKLVVEKMVNGLKSLNARALEVLSHKDAYHITIDEHDGNMGAEIDMELTLLENNPLDEDIDDSGEVLNTDELKEIIKKNGLNVE